MKKVLKIFLIALQTIFIARVVWVTVLFIQCIIDVYSHSHSSSAMFSLNITGIVGSVETVGSVLMILSLHVFIRNGLSAKPAHSLLNKVCLGTATAVNLLHYLTAYLLFIVVSGVDIPAIITFSLWVICVIVCIASLIAVGVKNAKAGRMLKAAESQGETADELPDQQPS